MFYKGNAEFQKMKLHNRNCFEGGEEEVLGEGAEVEPGFTLSLLKNEQKALVLLIS